MQGDSLDGHSTANGPIRLVIEVPDAKMTYTSHQMPFQFFQMFASAIAGQVASNCAKSVEVIPDSPTCRSNATRITGQIAIDRLSSILKVIQDSLLSLRHESPDQKGLSEMEVISRQGFFQSGSKKGDKTDTLCPVMSPTDSQRLTVQSHLNRLNQTLIHQLSLFETSIASTKHRLNSKLTGLTAILKDKSSKVDQLTNINRQLLSEIQFSNEHKKTIQNLKREMEKASERAEESEEKNRDLITQLSVMTTRIELTNKLKKKLEKQITLLELAEQQQQHTRSADNNEFRELSTEFMGSRLKADLNIIEEGDEFESENEDSLILKTTKLIKKISVTSATDAFKRSKLTRSHLIFCRPSRVPDKHDRMVQVYTDTPRDSRPTRRDASSFISMDNSTPLTNSGNNFKESARSTLPNSGLSGEPEVSKRAKKTNLFSTENIRKSIFDLQKEKDNEFLGSERNKCTELPTPRSQHSVSFLPITSNQEDPSPFGGPMSAKPRLFRPSLGGSVICRQTEASQLQDQLDRLHQSRKGNATKLRKLQERMVGIFGIISQLDGLGEKVVRMAGCVRQVEDSVKVTLQAHNQLTEKRLFGSVLPIPGKDRPMGKRQSNSTSNLKRGDLTDKNIPNSRELFISNLTKETPTDVPQSKIGRLINEKMKEFLQRTPGVIPINSSSRLTPTTSHFKPKTGATTSKSRSKEPNLYEVLGRKSLVVSHRSNSRKAINSNRGFKLSYVGDDRLPNGKMHGRLPPPIQKQLNFGNDDGVIQPDLSCRKSAYAKPNQCFDLSTSRDHVTCVFRNSIESRTDDKKYTSLGDDFGRRNFIDCEMPPSDRLVSYRTSDFKSDSHVRMLKGSLDHVSKELLSAKKRLATLDGESRQESIAQLNHKIHSLISHLRNATKTLEKEAFVHDDHVKKVEGLPVDSDRKEVRAAHHKPMHDDDRKSRIPLPFGTRNFKFKKYLAKTDLN